MYYFQIRHFIIPAWFVDGPGVTGASGWLCWQFQWSRDDSVCRLVVIVVSSNQAKVNVNCYINWLVMLTGIWNYTTTWLCYVWIKLAIVEIGNTVPPTKMFNVNKNRINIFILLYPLSQFALNHSAEQSNSSSSIEPKAAAAKHKSHKTQLECKDSLIATTTHTILTTHCYSNFNLCFICLGISHFKSEFRGLLFQFLFSFQYMWVK